MSFSVSFGNFLYKNAFGLYKPLYRIFKNRQDEFEIEILKKIVSPGSVVIDIGANIGYYATILSVLVGPKGKVHCFEPDLKNFAHLKKATALLKNVVINQKAIGPRTAPIRIYTSKELNVDHRTYQPEEFDKVTEIEAVSLDDYLKGEKVDVIKMDIQGFEMEALKGMTHTIVNNPEILILSEFWPYGLAIAGSSALVYFDFLQSLKFNVYLFENKKLEILTEEKVRAMKELGKEHYFNILATRKSV